MESILKNPRADEIIKKAISVYGKVRPGNIDKDLPITSEQVCEAILSAYTLDVIFRAQEHQALLDCTYDTLDKLPIGLQGVLQTYLKEKKRGSLNLIVSSTVKSYAAYLFLLSVNEHDCHLHGKLKQRNALLVKPEKEDPLWMDCVQILTGVKRELDFLPAVLEATTILDFGKKKLVSFTAEPICKAYRLAIGVDLTKHGLANIVLEV